ncbi:MAG: aminoglycoside 3'-phosphotransferase [Clostridia bacterium]|nr:aminoglycoside 3'-phosphotransferase [Clostridia bacterium]
MNLTPIKINPQEYPPSLRRYLEGANIFDSSSSPQAKVIYSDKDGGYFIKTSQKGALYSEATMTQYYYSLGLAPKALEYISDTNDFLVTAKVKGDDCINPKYLQQPQKLCETLASLLRELHSMDYSDCPIKNHTQIFLDSAKKNYREGLCDKDILKQLNLNNPDEAWDIIDSQKHLLRNEVLLHGDYCLPNVILDDWKLSGFIDVGNGGVGDRHVDIFWGIYTLFFNLKTHKYAKRFIDAYGKELVDCEKLRLIAAIEIFG